MSRLRSLKTQQLPLKTSKVYSKKEETILTEQFWLALGTYMKPIPSAEGEKINWINYKTGVKGIRFIMQATTINASIAIEISHDELVLQQATFERFLQLKKMFTSSVEGDWNWLPQVVSGNGKTIALISNSIENVNILNRNDWPALISFFKNNMLLLDRFWSENKFAFEF